GGSVRVVNTEAIDVWSADRAPGFCVPRRGEGLPPPAPPPPPPRGGRPPPPLPVAPLAEDGPFPAKPRGRAPFAPVVSAFVRNGVRLRSGMLFSLAGIPSGASAPRLLRRIRPSGTSNSGPRLPSSNASSHGR